MTGGDKEVQEALALMSLFHGFMIGIAMIIAHYQ
jgi:hypothetical protein